MKVKDVMNSKLVFCKPDYTVREAAKILKENSISGAPVLDGEELVGIISEADLLKLLILPEKGELWLPSPFEVIDGITEDWHSSCYLDNEQQNLDRR